VSTVISYTLLELATDMEQIKRFHGPILGQTLKFVGFILVCVPGLKFFHVVINFIRGTESGQLTTNSMLISLDSSVGIATAGV
jgi:hypothetical protein